MVIKKITKPNLFIVGAAKAGTTSLYNYLSQHPDIFMCPIKEPNHFCKDIKENSFTQKNRFYSHFDIDIYLSKDPLKIVHNAFIDDYNYYMQLFRNVYNEQIIGEASSSYLYSNLAAKEIHKNNPESKIIIILRDPIERAFSHWKMNLSVGFEKKNSSFIDAIKKDYNLQVKGYYRSHLYIELGLYFEQIWRYISIFPKEQILILLYEDLSKNSEDISERLFSFINVKPISINLKKTRFNESKMQRFPKLTRLVRKYNLSKLVPDDKKDSFRSILMSKKKLIISNNARSQLFNYFHSDIKKLEGLINRDLSNWYY